MPFAVPRALPLSLLAALVLAGCAEKGAAPLKKGEKPLKNAVFHPKTSQKMQKIMVERTMVNLNQ